jgi:hypothetical protein
MVIKITVYGDWKFGKIPCCYRIWIIVYEMNFFRQNSVRLLQEETGIYESLSVLSCVLCIQHSRMYIPLTTKLEIVVLFQLVLNVIQY